MVIPEVLRLKLIPQPDSIEYIKKSLKGKKLTREETYTTVRDTVVNVLTESEFTALMRTKK